MAIQNYNIPGNGEFTTNIFRHTEYLIEFLENYGHIDRLRNISQLGRLRDIFPGAHHNRYEYVFLQWTLISEISKQKGNNYGFSSERLFFDKISNSSKYPSSSEIIQCLILLTNIGYSDGTFAANRAWLHVFKENKDIKKLFRAGLNKIDRPLFDQLIDESNFYNLNIFFALFLLSRYKRTDNSGCIEFASKLLRAYFIRDSSNVHLTKIWDVYSNIRKIAFLALDSIYAPVPFTLNLTSIVLSFGKYYEEIFIKKSAYKNALDELENVLQNSVYLNSESILNTNKATEEIVQYIYSKKNELTTISNLFKVLKCNSEIDNKWKSYNRPDWNSQQIISLNFENTKGFLPLEIANDSYKWEIKIRNRIGKSKIRIGALTNIEKNVLKISASIIDEKFFERLKTALNLSYELIKLTRLFKEDYYNPDNVENSEKLFSIILKSIFGWDKRFILQAHDVRYNPFIIEDGKYKTLKAIDKYIDKVKNEITADQLCEIEQTRKAVEKFNYSGITLVFTGAAKIFNANKNNEVAEFDGLLIYPKKNLTEYFFYIIESKNYPNGFSDAQKQLSKRLRTLTPDSFSYSIEKLSTKCAIGKFKYHT